MYQFIILYTLATLLTITALHGCGNDINNTTGSNNPIDNSDNSNQNNDNSVNTSDEEDPASDDATDLYTPCISPNSILDDSFLWKPVSESDGNLVILFDSKYGIRFDKVTVTLQSGLTEELTFSAFANGGRQHWRGTSPGIDYTGEIVVTQKTNICSAVVLTPGERYEGK